MQNFDKGVMRLKVILAIISKAVFSFHCSKMMKQAGKCEVLSCCLLYGPATEATGSSSALWSDEREVGPQILSKPSEADACDFLLPIVIHMAGYTGSKTSSETLVGSFSILIN